MEGSSDDAGYWSIPDRRRYNIIHLEGIFRVGAGYQDRFAEEIDAVLEVDAFGDEDCVAFDGGVDAGLDCGVVEGNVNRRRHGAFK